MDGARYKLPARVERLDGYLVERLSQRLPRVLAALHFLVFAILVLLKAVMVSGAGESA